MWPFTERSGLVDKTQKHISFYQAVFQLKDGTQVTFPKDETRIIHFDDGSSYVYNEYGDSFSGRYQSPYNLNGLTWVPIDKNTQIPVDSIAKVLIIEGPTQEYKIRSWE